MNLQVDLLAISVRQRICHSKFKPHGAASNDVSRNRSTEAPEILGPMRLRCLIEEAQRRGLKGACPQLIQLSARKLFEGIAVLEWASQNNGLKHRMLHPASSVPNVLPRWKINRIAVLKKSIAKEDVQEMESGSGIPYSCLCFLLSSDDAAQTPTEGNGAMNRSNIMDL